MSDALPRRKRLGDVLIDKGIIDEDRLRTALADQRESGALLPEVLVRLGYVSEDALAAVLTEWLELPFMDIGGYKLRVSNEVFGILPQNTIRQYRIVPLAIADEALIVVTAAPLPPDVVKELETMAGCEIKLHTGRVSDVKELLGANFGLE